jgi:hypothetical protein
MRFEDIPCEVQVPREEVLGTYANALRILQDGSEFLMDFCVVSREESVARVVCRLRVAPEFLQLVQDKLHRGLSATESEENT